MKIIRCKKCRQTIEYKGHYKFQRDYTKVLEDSSKLVPITKKSKELCLCAKCYKEEREEGKKR